MGKMKLKKRQEIEEVSYDAKESWGPWTKICFDEGKQLENVNKLLVYLTIVLVQNRTFLLFSLHPTARIEKVSDEGKG